MKRISFLIAVIALLFAGAAKAQTYQWVKGGGSTDPLPLSIEKEKIVRMCTDPNGNIYALGTVGSSSLTADTFYRPAAYGVSENMFVASYNCQGQMRWAKLIASSGGGCYPYDIAADKSGHVYVAGLMTPLTLHIGYDTTIGLIYQKQGLIQFDTLGDFKWVRWVGDNTMASWSGANGEGSTIVIDSADNAHFFCFMKSGVHLSPTLTSSWGTYNLKYNTSGTLLDIKRLQLSDTTLYCLRTTIDKSGKVFAIGKRSSLFGGGDFHPFIAAFDTALNLIWKDTVLNPFASSSGSGARFTALTSDDIGNLYAVAQSNSWLIYRTDTIKNTLPPGGVACAMKLDTSGVLKWVRGYSYTLSSGFLDACMIGSNKVGFVGGLLGKVKVGNDSATSFAGETQNLLFSVVDTSGNVHSLEQVHGTGTDIGFACAADKSGNFFMGGQVGSNIWGGSITPYVSIGGSSDYFVMKYGVNCSCTPADVPYASYSDTGTIAHGFFYTGTTATIDSVRWDFGDGGTSTLSDPSHTYTTADTFNACVRVYTPCGSDMYCKEIRIPCITAPTPAFTMSGTGLIRTFTYTGSGTGVTGISWTFTDGGTATGSLITHTFSAAATYTACVTATNPCGTTTTCNPITITCTATPVSAYTVTPGAGLTKIFTYTGTTTGLDSVTWTYGDGGTGVGLTPSHTFSAAGTYTVCAKVYTNCGTHTWCSTIVVTCVTSPVSSYTSSGGGLTKFFIYTGTTAGMDSVTWTFGDGGTATGTTPTHTYLAAGIYTVCAKVYTNCGTHIWCSSVTVTCPTSPVASFTYTASGGTLIFTYTGTTAGMDSVRWDFGDGGTSGILNPTHVYTTEDTFHVCVNIYTNCGSHTSCQDIPVICFLPITSAFIDTGTLVHGFSYTGTMAGYDSVVWTFGDGGTDTGLNVIHTYVVTDTYNVCATIFTDCGTHTWCKDIMTAFVGVPNMPADRISVYPNPSTSELYVANVPHEMQYRLTNVIGITVGKGTLNPGTNTLLVQQLPPGVYVLELSADNIKGKVVKIVKQ